MEGISFRELLQVIVGTGARRIVDIRSSPSFQGGGLSPNAVFRALADNGVVYEHVPELANTFLADSWNSAVTLARYASYIRQNARAYLHRLRSQVATGPVLVLGWAAEHAGSDREVVVDELASIDADFDLTVVQRG
jgi:hypothetical protein